jgi:hypothetical protein
MAGEAGGGWGEATYETGRAILENAVQGNHRDAEIHRGHRDSGSWNLARLRILHLVVKDFKLSSL